MAALLRSFAGCRPPAGVAQRWPGGRALGARRRLETPPPLTQKTPQQSEFVAHRHRSDSTGRRSGRLAVVAAAPPGAGGGVKDFAIAPVGPSDGKKKKQRPCRRCKGAETIACKDCKGTGNLPRGGYHSRNPINIKRITGSKWTAMERTFGWRHFQATQKRREGKATYVLLRATCDEAVQFWVNVENLKDRQKFASGWLRKVELNGTTDTGAECRTCAGCGAVACPICTRPLGEVVEL